MRLPVNEPEFEGINMIPLINVFLVLLIFFLVATRLGQDEREISVRLAQVSKAQPLATPPHEVVVNVTDKGEYVVIGQTLGEPALAGFLHDLSIKKPGDTDGANPRRRTRAIPLSGPRHGTLRGGETRALLHGDGGSKLVSAVETLVGWAE